MSNEPSVKEQIARLKAAIELKKRTQQAPPAQPPPQSHRPAYRPPPHQVYKPYNAHHSTFKNRTLVVNKSNPSNNSTTLAPSSASTSKNKILVVNAPAAQSPQKSTGSTPLEAKDLPKFITKGNKLIRAGVVIKKVPDINESYAVFKLRELYLSVCL
ncbi:UNVERIFIED_CONTAM: hypothetical protein HDU68_007157 [Siphonaria sp. JEL0065]|nr:hypothetical protein HDU68_007157 [Siphonaria sp. JEL0065]